MKARPPLSVIARWLAAAAMLAAAGVIYYAARSLANPDPGAAVGERRIVRPDDGSHRPPSDASPPRVMGIDLPPTAADLPEPADLPPPAGAMNLLRRTSGETPPREITSVWSIADATLADVASYYRQAATDRGFASLNQAGSVDQTVERLVFEADHRLLTVRCRQVGDAVRVVIQLRYTSTPGSD